MKILELNINEFGCIKDKKILFDNGINIVYGKNEAGKSTVLLFIKFMLYGIPKRKTAERDRALSRDGRRAAGTMLVSYFGKRYLIERAVVLGSKSEHLKITDLETGENISGEPWEMFLGVPADAFESCCCVSQMRTSEISRAGAASAIENMLVSADESIDVEKVLARLDAVRKEYKLNRGEGGSLYDTTLKISMLREKQRDATEKHLLLNEKSEKLSRSESMLEQVTKECERSDKILRELHNIEILRRFENIDALYSEHNDAKKSLSLLEAEASINGFIPDEAHMANIKSAYFAFREAIKKTDMRKAQYDSLPSLSDEDSRYAVIGESISAKGGKDAALQDIRALDKKAHTKKVVGAVLVAAGALCAAIGIAMLKKILLLAALCSVGAISIVSGIVMLAAAKKGLSKRDGLCAEYGVDYRDIETYMQKCLDMLNAQRAANTEIIAARTRLEEAQGNREKAEEQLVGLLKKTTSITDRSPDALRMLTESETRKIEALCKKRRELSVSLGSLEAQISALKKELTPYDRDELRASVTLDADTVTPELVATAQRTDSFNKARRSALEKEVRELRETVITLRAGISQSPVEIADRICTLEEKLHKDTEYYDALMLAKSSIESASLSMSGNVTPEISRRAGEMLDRISEGAHSSVQTNKDLELSVEEKGFLLSSDSLSGGTRDAAYIALRISLMLRLFTDELPPILLDESLCQLDDGRAMGVLSVLASIPDAPQCILFTCHSREQAICDRENIKYMGISL